MGMASAVPSMSRSGIGAVRPALFAISKSFGRLEADDLRRCPGIERQIETGTDTDLKDSTSRTRYNAVAIRREHTLPHGQMYEPWNDSLLIGAHCFAKRT